MKLLLILSAFLVASAPALAGGAKAVNFSAIPNVALYPKTEVIHGFTLSLWGENEQTSFALGLVNGLTGNSSGLALGVFNYSDNYTGAQLGFFNWARKNTTGLQGAFANYTAGVLHGAQVGIVNVAGKLRGLQLGFVNYAQSAENGIQVGFVNVLTQTTGWFSEFPKNVAPVMLFANWRF